MFLGELSCLVAFKMLFFYHKYRKTDKDFGPQKFNPLILLPPAMCDMCATSLMYIGKQLRHFCLVSVSKFIFLVYCWRYVIVVYKYVVHQAQFRVPIWWKTQKTTWLVHVAQNIDWTRIVQSFIELLKQTMVLKGSGHYW